METIKLYKGMTCVNIFSEATNGKDFKEVAQEVAEQYDLTFSPMEEVVDTEADVQPEGELATRAEVVESMGEEAVKEMESDGIKTVYADETDELKADVINVELGTGTVENTDIESIKA